MNKQVLFQAGVGDYPIYRIPTVVTLPGNRVVAFCEGRRNGVSDYGTIEIVARISKDGGETWGEQILVAKDGENTVGNPSPVYDRETGVLHLLLNGNLKDGGEGDILEGKAPRTVLYTFSRDGGETWAELRDLTADVKLAGWTWYAIGPCHAVQLRTGRLLAACNHAILAEGRKYVSHSIYSDDHGATWKLGGNVGFYTNECTLAELEDGRIYMNMRSNHGEGCRAVAYSDDGGETWYDLRLDKSLPDPVCQGSVLSTRNFGGREGTTLLFSNAADAEHRRKMTLRKCTDDGKTWSSGVLVHEGYAAYSDIAVLEDGRVGLLYECGEEVGPYERIEWAILNPDEIQ